MKTITVNYNYSNQFDGCTLDSGEIEGDSAESLYDAACKLASDNDIKFIPDGFAGCHPDAPEVWEFDESDIRDDDYRQFQTALEDVFALGEFWVTS